MNKKSFFWASYADLMSSLFFIMLVLFVLTVIMLQKQVKATEAEINKIKEIQNAISNIDSTYFAYNAEHKKHILKIDVGFQINSADITDIELETRQQLLNAGKAINQFIKEACQKYNAQYLLIIEGQASKDNFIRNNELSYERALALVNYWKNNGVYFNSEQCEVIVSGSGQDGTLRMQPDVPGNVKNQRFLIHILPKPGVIK
ncbi:OmpA family protein [Bacteroides sp. ET225]|uniref:OmpA family protein n=1 Tax=Bacteroides sp. ET225 TaxID=2972461 RepID=UPI0021ACB0BC|nr:OmpA family protein [Bacteroides sp. ET225]MCR8916652.1 OmpA family protein [Bacteroides sp. ET225]